MYEKEIIALTFSQIIPFSVLRKTRKRKDRHEAGLMVSDRYFLGFSPKLVQTLFKNP